MTTNIKKNRDSSLELLRIVCMIMIICHHYAVHGGYSEVTVNAISIGTVYISILSMFGKVACGVFAMITGYFMIDSKNGLKEQLKKSILLSAEMIFYSLLVVAFIYFTKVTTVSIKDFLKAFVPFFKGNWYVRSYIFFSLGIPYINLFLKSISKKIYEEMLMLIFIVWIVLSTVFGNTIDIGCLGFMLFMYFFGAYTKMYELDKYDYNNKMNLYIALACAFILILSVIGFNVLAVITKASIFLSHDRWFMPWNSLFAFGMSYFLFLYACRKHFYNNFINTISSTLLGVYLLHDNALMMKVIWEIWMPNKLYVNNPFLHSLIKILVVFVVGIVIDLIRQNTTGKLFKKWLNNNYDKLYECIIKICEKIKIIINRFIFQNKV